jgi:hypothetical protein
MREWNWQEIQRISLLTGRFFLGMEYNFQKEELEKKVKGKGGKIEYKTLEGETLQSVFFVMEKEKYCFSCHKKIEGEAIECSSNKHRVYLCKECYKEEEIWTEE